MVFKPRQSASKKWRRLKPTSPTSDDSSKVDRNRPIVMYNELLLKQTGRQWRSLPCGGPYTETTPSPYPLVWFAYPRNLTLKQTGYRMGEIVVRTACSERFFSVSPIAGGGCRLREFGALI